MDAMLGLDCYNTLRDHDSAGLYMNFSITSIELSHSSVMFIEEMTSGAL